MNRRQLLATVATVWVSGCTSEVEIRQPTPTLGSVEQYGSDKNIRIKVQSVRFDRSECRLRMTGTVTDIEWPTANIAVVLFLYDDRRNIVTSRRQVYNEAAPGEVIPFEFDTALDECDQVTSYEIVGRRIQS